MTGAVMEISQLLLKAGKRVNPLELMKKMSKVHTDEDCVTLSEELAEDKEGIVGSLYDIISEETFLEDERIKRDMAYA